VWQQESLCLRLRSVGAAADQGSRDRSGATAAQGAGGDREFIHTLAFAGMTEVQLGKFAAERGQDADVKAFGQMMVKDHTQAGEKLKEVASQAGVPLPTELDDKHRELVDRLAKPHGAESIAITWRPWSTGSKVRQRTQDVSTSTRSGSSSNPSPTGTTAGTPGTTTGGGASNPAGSANQGVREWAMKTLPVVEQHLQRARELRDRVDKGR
jgi:Domain of unknown function (DUF4142)